jgi:NAD kinase
MPFDQGAPQFGVNDAKIATWNTTDSYGTLTDVMGIQMAQVTIQIISAIANGDDRIVAAASRLTGAQLQMRFVGLNPTSMSVLTGVDTDEISSVINQQFAGGERMPYFGAIVKALSEEIGDTWIFLPKCKIMSDFVLFQGEFGAFSTPEVTVQCVPDETWGLANFITHPTDVPISVIPPANIAEIV